MASANAKKIVLSSSRDIPFNKLLLSQSNVRHVKAGVSIEELAEDVARRGLLQGLSVRAVLDADGVETGMYEIPAGGRRYRALQLLVKQKRLAKSAPVPCVVRQDGIAEEDSLAENIQRAPLHPLDQFRAFLALKEKGQSEEDIAAAFFVGVNVVKQRLKLASVSPKLLDVYAEDGMTLDQLMAFTVSGDHERQEQVFQRVQNSYDKQPYAIRRMLTEGGVRASDKRALFIGIDPYVACGGVVMRDLFQSDDGGWLQDAVLVDRMVDEKLKIEAATIAAEGWKWIEVAVDLPYGHTFGLRQLRGEPIAMSEEEQVARDALQAEYDQLAKDHAEADELPDEVDSRLGELETAMETLNARPLAFDTTDRGRAGAFVSIAPDGSLRVQRGFVRAEDEVRAEDAIADEPEDGASASAQGSGETASEAVNGQAPDDDRPSPLSDRLIIELTTHRTLALRVALARDPDLAFLAALHAFTLKVFYVYTSYSCLELDLKSVNLAAQTPGLNDSPCAETTRSKHDGWVAKLPKEPQDLWQSLRDLDQGGRAELFAYLISLSVNAVAEPWNRRPGALAHADSLADAVSLDMSAAGWRPTVDTYFGRVIKARILEAVTEAKGAQVADRISNFKKGDMATEAESLLRGSGWLPQILRAPECPSAVADEAYDPGLETAGEESAGNGGETAMAENAVLEDSSPAQDAAYPIAAE
jgi:ParB family chromosome partitioning protein